MSSASLLDRLNVAPSERLGGADRSNDRGGRNSPYARPPKASADDDGPWKHDMFASQNDIEGGTLGARLAVKERTPVTGVSQSSLALKKALASVKGMTGDALSIRGASGSVVEVRELVKGTTAADVEAIFKRCGPIVSTVEVSNAAPGTTTIRVKFKQQSDAEKAVSLFHGQPADGRILQVELLNGVTLKSSKETGIVSVDGLLDDDSFASSKLRSDAILATDSRAQVLTDPFPNSGRGGRVGRRGRGRGRGGRGQGSGGMDLD